MSNLSDWRRAHRLGWPVCLLCLAFALPLLSADEPPAEEPAAKEVRSDDAIVDLGDSKEATPDGESKSAPEANDHEPADGDPAADLESQPTEPSASEEVDLPSPAPAPTPAPSRLRKQPAKKSTETEEDPESKDDEPRRPSLRPREEDAPVLDPEPEVLSPEEERAKLDRELIEQFRGDATMGDEPTDPLQRARQRMRTVEQRLAEKQIEENVVVTQEKIVEDLETLLKQMQNANPNPKPQDENQDQEQRDKEEQQRQQQQQQSGSQGKRQLSIRDQEQPSSDSFDGARFGRASREELNQLRESRDIWGHLGDMLRQDMSQYAKEDFLPRYRDQIERYFTTIAAEGSRERKE